MREEREYKVGIWEELSVFRDDERVKELRLAGVKVFSWIGDARKYFNSIVESTRERNGAGTVEMSDYASGDVIKRVVIE